MQASKLRRASWGDSKRWGSPWPGSTYWNCKQNVLRCVALRCVAHTRGGGGRGGEQRGSVRSHYQFDSLMDGWADRYLFVFLVLCLGEACMHTYLVVEELAPGGHLQGPVLPAVQPVWGAVGVGVAAVTHKKERKSGISSLFRHPRVAKDRRSIPFSFRSPTEKKYQNTHRKPERRPSTRE